MKTTRMIALFGVMLLLAAGTVFALSGAQNDGSVTERGRWSGNTSGNITTEGGNISGQNVGLFTLTDRWAAVYGNVSGGIALMDNASNTVYSWTWSADNGGEVCLSKNSALVGDSTDINAMDAAAVATLNADFGHGASSDNATSTLTTFTCDMNFTDVDPGVTANVTLNSGFDTCAFDDTTGGAETAYVFCTTIDNNGTNYNSEPADYEVMVPTTPGDGETETYYFYAELD